MPSRREPIQLLEPSDLLEPLDLRDHHADSVYALAYQEYGGTANSAFGRTSARASSPTPVRRGSPALRSALIVAGALACFGAGAAFSQFPNLPFVDGDSSSTMASAIPPTPRAADAAVKRDDPAPAAAPNNAQQATASREPKQAATPSAPQQSATPPAKEQAALAAPACDAQTSLKDDSRCLAGATVQPAATGAKPTRASDPIPLNASAATQPVAQAETPAAADRPRAETRASCEKQRAQSSRSNRRAMSRRDPGERSTADNNVPSTRWSFRRQGDDTNRASGDRRDWATDDSRTTAYSTERWQDRDNDRWQNREAGRWPDRDADRAYGWRRERSDAYARGNDRVRGDDRTRGWREDERMNGRPPREEAPPMFAPFRSW
jgi:hypothetical protein